mmetsp:Transcript_12805/g.33902  ORF Transcript_12805/g.33902 Transcript_12805/m.33902 type:complete len:253 (+) Transcript_12805:343-1101(+)
MRRRRYFWIAATKNAVHRHSAAEAVLRSVVGCQLRHLVRGTSIGCAKYVHRAHAATAGSPDRDGVATNRHGAAELVARRGVGGRQLGHLVVRGAAVARAEDVGCFLAMGPDHDGIATDRHGVAEVVPRCAVGGRQLDLRVRGPAVGCAEDVGRARHEAGVVVAGGTDHDCAAGDGHGSAEVVVRRGVGCRQLGHLNVRGAAVARAEDVGRARAGALVRGSNHDGVAIDRHGVAEPVAIRGVGGRKLGNLAVS